MIGAGELSEKARVLEMAAKENDSETVRKEHAPFMEDYTNLLSIIGKEEALEFSSKAGSADPANATVADDALEFSPKTESTDAAAATDDDEALEFFPKTDSIDSADTAEEDEYEALEFTPAGQKEDEN